MDKVYSIPTPSEMAKFQPGQIKFTPETAAGGSALDAVHYQVGDKQPIEIMQDYLTPEQFVGFLRACALKYLLRMGRKDSALKDAQKAAQYAKWLSQAMRGEKIRPMED